MMGEGEDYVLIASRQEDDVVREVAQDEPFHAMLAQVASSGHAGYFALLEQIQPRLECTLESLTEPGAFAFVPCRRGVRLVSGCWMYAY